MDIINKEMCMRKEVLEKLTVIFRENFDDQSILLSENTSAKDIEDWDSLEQINLIIAIQDTFMIRFNIDEVNTLKNVGEMINMILNKVK